MSENIKVSDGILGEINGLKSVADTVVGMPANLNNTSSLPTCKSYARHGREIGETYALFRQLIQHDMKQIQKFVDNMKAQDNS